MRPRLLHNCRIVDHNHDVQRGWLLIESDKIADRGAGNAPEGLLGICDAEDLDGAVVLPGVIDEHVHFRQPGMTEKGDMATESRAAASGGVTTFFDMPNTKPATITPEAWEHKMALGAEHSLVNYSFFIGATPDNLNFLKVADYRHIPGIKLFMGATTGTSATDSEQFLDSLFAMAPATIAVHAEDEAVIACAREAVLRSDNNPGVNRHPDIRTAEACFVASKRICAFAEKYSKRLHLMHVSTAAELDLLKQGDPAVKLITAETCPQYLLFDRKDYERLGARIKCNPAIKESFDREALLKAVIDGRIDTIGTDHAPHLLEQKQGGALIAASGMPGVQFALPLMLEIAESLGQSLSLVARLMATNPASVWHIDRRGSLFPGYYADVVVVSKENKRNITDGDVLSRCGWTPYADFETHWVVNQTIVNGQTVYSRNKGVTEGQRAACAIEFNN